MEDENGRLPPLCLKEHVAIYSPVVLYVHSSSQSLTSGEALGKLCPVVIILQFKWYPLWLCPYLFVDLGAGGVTVRIWESLYVMESLKILNSIS